MTIRPLILNLIFARRNYGPRTGTQRLLVPSSARWTFRRIIRPHKAMPTTTGSGATMSLSLTKAPRYILSASAARETFTSTLLNPQTTMTFSARRKEEVKRTYNYSTLAMPRALLFGKMNYLFHTELAQPHRPMVKAPDQIEHFCERDGDQ